MGSLSDSSRMSGGSEPGPRAERWRDVLGGGAVFLVGSIFFISALGKAINPDPTIDVLRDLLDASNRGLFGVFGILPLIEFGVAASLAVQTGRRFGLITAGLLLVAFSAVLIKRGIGNESCGCGLPGLGSVLGSEMWTGLLRNVVLVVLVVLGLALVSSPRQSHSLPEELKEMEPCRQ